MASYNYMMSADEVAQELNCSKSHALRWLEEYQRRFGQKRCMAMK